MNQPIRILYVDDYPLDRELVRDALEKEDRGFELVEAASRADFETNLAKGGFDLVLCDFNILGFEGLQVLETVRTTGSHLPVIIVTGTGSEEIAVEAFKRGAADYVIKTPDHIQRLPHTIRAVLEMKRLENQRQQVDDEIRKLNAELEGRVEARTRELREAQEKLVRQERLAVLGQLAGGVGHELRNPLGVIGNAIYFLELIQPNADDKTKEYFNIIENETRTAEKIINDLLDYSRIKPADSESVTVAELFQRVLERHPAPAAVTISVKTAARLPPVYADPRQMLQVLGYLVDNAYQAMPEGGELTLSAKKKGDMAVISVQDTGVGISPENMAKLFEPLFTTKMHGIGLGLAVSKKLVESNNGRIEVSSPPGKGATFRVYLPSYQEEYEKVV